MRKVLSFVLVLALVLGSFSMAFAATPTDVVGTANEEAVNVLMNLGVVDGYPDGTFKPAQAVTRAEMAKLIVVALGLEDYAIGTSKFADMAGATWAQGFVNYATGLGVIKGYPDGTFKPSQTVSYDEAAAMIVRALGYTDESLTGTWPANYVVKAKALGILDDVKSAVGGANRGDIAEMLYNALSLDIGYVNNDGNWTANDTSEDGDNPDNMLVRLGASFEDAAVITGEEDSAINLRAYVGAYAETYLNDDEEIIAVVPSSTFLTGEWDDDFSTFSTDDKDYNDDSDQKYDDTENALKFTNGEEKTFTLEDGVTYTVAVDLSGKTIKEMYSISLWTVTADGLFEDSDAADITEDQELFGQDFILDDNDEIDLNSFELVGVAALADIAEDDVVYVYAADGDIRKVAVGTEIVSGEITKISSSDDYTIDGTTYDLSDVFNDADSDSVEAGDNVDAYLDAYGDIYQLTLTDGTNDDYAVVIETANGIGSGLNGYDPAIKMVLADATDETFDVDSDDIDDSIIDGNTWAPAWVGTAFAGNIVEYGLDEDGVVDSLDAVSTSTLNGETGTNVDITEKGYYHGYKIASDAVIWTLDGESTDEDNYGTATLEDVKGTDNVTAQIYVEDSEIVAMLIYDFDATDAVYGVVTDWATNNSDAGNELTFLIDGEEVTYDATDDAIDDFGDNYATLFAIEFDASGDVVDELSFARAADDVNVEYLYDVVLDGYVVTEAADTAPIDEYTLDSEVIVYVWNEDDGVFDVGSRSDIDEAEYVTLFDTIDDDLIYDIVLVDVDGDLIS